MWPEWSPDGSRIAYVKPPAYDLYQKHLTTERTEELSAGPSYFPSWSVNGFVLFDKANQPTEPGNLWAVRVDSNGKTSGEPFRLFDTPADERAAQISPDGKWVAYTSNRAGRREIFVRAYSGPAPEQRISTNGGVQVRWRRDGKELFYLAPDGRLMAVQINITPEGFRPGSPVALFPTHAWGTFDSVGNTYAVSADGQRFLMLTSKATAVPAPIKLILNWKAQP
jgi:Tol biopolymer transport system component